MISNNNTIINYDAWTFSLYLNFWHYRPDIRNCFNQIVIAMNCVDRWCIYNYNVYYTFMQIWTKTQIHWCQQVIRSIFSSNQIHHHKCQIQIQIHGIGTCNALKTILTNHMILKKKIEKNCPVWIWRKPVIISWQWSLLDKGYVPLLFWITNLGNGDHDFLLLFRPLDHFLDPVPHVLLWLLD